MSTTPLPDGARCAIHPERAAERTCVRCGNYMCSECTSTGPAQLCLTCASRVGPTGDFPFARDRYNLDGLVRLSFSRWKDHWVMFLLLFGGAIVAVYGTSLGGEWILDFIADRAGETSPLQSPLHPVRLGFQIAVTVLQVLVQLLLLGVCIDVLQGRKSDAEAATQRLRQLPNALLQLLLIYAAIAFELGLLYLLFLAVGGFDAGWRPYAIAFGAWFVTLPIVVYLWLGISFGMLVLLTDRDSNAFSALKTSWRIVSGHRFEVLGISLVAGIIAGAGVIACCVGVFATIPIASLLYCALFLALRSDPSPAA